MNKKNKKPQHSPLRLFYFLLPYFLMAFTFFNLWFCYFHVQQKSENLASVKDDVMQNVSNVYHYVMHTLSNQIRVASVRSSIRDRSYFVSDRMTNIITSQVSTVLSDSVSVVDSNLSLPFRFARVFGSPFVHYNGSYFGVGDDFGRGPIERITPLYIIVAGHRIPLFNSPDKYASRNDLNRKFNEDGGVHE